MDEELEETCRRLMVRVQAGDKGAYRELLDAVCPRFRNYLERRVPESDVDDVVQETLITMHRVRDSWDASRPFGPWMYALANHRAQDLRRSQWRISRRNELSLSLNASSGECVRTLAFEARHDLAGALKKLSERQRTVVTLLKLEDLSVEEIADRLSMTVSAVKVTAHRAYDQLRRLLGTKDHGA